MKHQTQCLFENEKFTMDTMAILGQQTAWTKHWMVIKHMTIIQHFILKYMK